MDRRRFLKNVAVGATIAGSGRISDAAERSNPSNAPVSAVQGRLAADQVDTNGHTLVCELKIDSTDWKVYEDLRTREGSITFVSSRGAALVLPKTAEAAFAEAKTPYLGLSLKDIGMSPRDLLADRLLAKGDPDPDMVKSAAPPQGAPTGGRQRFRSWRWETFVGTKQAFDTMPVYPLGSTPEAYHSLSHFPEFRPQFGPQSTQKRYAGLVGGWMPAPRDVIQTADSDYYEFIVFGDVEAHDLFIVQTWHRAVRVVNGKIKESAYGHSYPPFPSARQDPGPEEVYRALFKFAEYWNHELRDFSAASLPQQSWVWMSKHAFAKELMVRPGGTEPKYGAVDRAYYGSEYDGFQDIFTMATYANLEWGRFEQARKIIDNYFSDFVDSKGVNNMRGPEVAQFGMTLSLMARYFNYTRDAALLLKHRAKIEATAAILTALHDESLRLPPEDIGHGLIHGWCESDSCLAPKPETWWLPYFSHNAYASRGLKDLGEVWPKVNLAKPTAAEADQKANDWRRRSKILRDALIPSMRKDVRKEMNPPYIGPFPGTKLTFWESMQKEHPSPQQWVHRAYSELLQADVLPDDLANLVIDCMRAYGATTLGIVANVEPPHPTGRDILGFISYGYAQMLLRLDRIEEFLLFLYAHRYHDHSRGSWVAGEVAGITGGQPLFCIPAQQTIPLLVRWMLVLEDSDEDRLYLAKGLAREWVISGKKIMIQQSPTRWGRINFSLQAKPEKKEVVAIAELARSASPRELEVKFRLPAGMALKNATVNGRAATFSGLHSDVVAFKTGREKSFEVVVQFEA